MLMSEMTSDVVVTERRRSPRRRLSETKSVAEAVVERRSPAPAPPAATEQSVEERRQIIDRRRLDRRRQIDPTTCERDYSDPEIEFMRAMDDYKRKSGRPFPTWSEVLEVFMSLGYRKVADPSTLEWRTFGDSVGTL
ncbi:MAG: hypothetical protein JNM43_15225 [Planctomycetaceae bacterium]|nr:hypothetical protein [Planctomycetaceae bacterium]